MIVRLHNLRPTLILISLLDRPDPPPVWTHPCKCTLVAHETCLLHWINTQQRDFGRSRGELKCPQCGTFYEFEGYNPRILRILNSANRALSRSGRVIIGVCAGTVIVSFGAGECPSHRLGISTNIQDENRPLPDVRDIRCLCGARVPRTRHVPCAPDGQPDALAMARVG